MIYLETIAFFAHCAVSDVVHVCAFRVSAWDGTGDRQRQVWMLRSDVPGDSVCLCNSRDSLSGRAFATLDAAFRLCEQQVNHAETGVYLSFKAV